MKITKNLVPESNYKNKCPYEMKPTRIVVHNTANDASAANEIAYMRRNTNEVSFHYAVDDKEVVQGIEENRNSWNAGDGGKGKGNREGIAIEICYSKTGGEKFIKAEQNAVELIVDILKRYGWGIDRVTKHQD
jgi:N-acetylmuramoyl-L-alanine amidase CwlA